MRNKRDAYLKIVEWSEEDQCYIGTAPGLMLGGVHGDDEASVYVELCQVVDEWIDIHEEDDLALPSATAQKDYSGQFVLRVEPELHRVLAIRAAQRNQSLNSFCKSALVTMAMAKAANPRKAATGKPVRKKPTAKKSSGSRRTPAKKATLDAL